MNEQERREFDRLKLRQAELLEQMTDLSRKLDAFEQRMVAAPAPAVPVPQRQAPVATPIPAPVAVPPPVPAYVPPVIVAQSAPAPEIHAKTARIFQPPPAPRVPAPIAASAQTSTFKSPEPAKAAAPAAKSQPVKNSSFEMRLGTYWLVRIGIVMLLTSLVFFGNYAYRNFIPHLGAMGKVSLLYLASGVLLGIGAWLGRKQDSMRNYAQVLLAGGLAAVYFTTYAAHHFANLQIIPSATVDGVLLLAWAGFIIWVADRKKSEVLAIFALLLAYYTSVITHAGLFTLYSNLVLTLAAVFFLVRNRWATVSFAGLAATYISYAFWRFFHAGLWRWAEPTEGLWTGNCFLIGYWLLFTAAVFLSRHEQFNGGRRASFLSINNGAFFSAFLLSMLQVHQGGFWKFSLIFGTVLVGLAALAWRVLTGDKLARNAYLTQGLLLVTLGFLTHLAGLKLSLVLGVESVILLMIGQQLKSRVMQAGSLITSALAVGYAVVTIEPFDHNGLITGSAVGALMLWNAFSIRGKITFDQSSTQPRILFYTVLALAMWLATTWQNASGDWRGLAVAGESIAILLAARPLSNRVLVFGAYVFAGIALSWETIILGRQFVSVEISERVGLLQGILLGVALLFNSLWEQRLSPPANRQQFHPPVTFFSALGLLAWLLTTGVFTPHEYLAPLLAIEALALTAAFYPLRLKEFALFGQLYLVLAQALWLYDSVSGQLASPWWNPVIIIAATLLLAAWWPRQKSFVIKQPVVLALQGLYALAIVGLLYAWLQPQFAAPTWLALASLLAVLLTIYAAVNRFWLLAAAGQIFLIVSAWEFCEQLWEGKPDWDLSLVPIAALCALSFSAHQWFERRPEAKVELRSPILGLSLVYRVIALLMFLWWVHKYIPTQEIIWVLALIGLLLFLAAGWRRNQELLIFGAVFTLTGLAELALPWNGATAVYWPNLLAILALLVQQQIAKRRPDNFPLPGEIHVAAIALGGLSLWLFVSRWILEQTTGFYLTAGWAVLALALFIVGMALRERVYRWLGLGVLASALGRVVIFDVWKLETIYCIFCFFALGIVLLVLGFIYNKYQEKIKEWL